MGRMIAAEQRAHAVLSRLPDGPLVGAEVGVFDGRMSRHLLERADLTLYMVDRWDPPTPSYAASGDPRATEDMGAAMDAARRATAFAGTRARLVREATPDAAIHFSAIDFAFIDADHSYEAVAADIESWRHTLKPGGLLCGHDYGDRRFGVTRAVDEACRERAWALELGEDRTWFVRP